MLARRARAASGGCAISSAGCSTGEEPYTLAILVARVGLFDGWDLDVFGSDISRRVLAQARAGALRRARVPHAGGEPRCAAGSTRAAGGGCSTTPSSRDGRAFAHLNLLDAARARVLGARGRRLLPQRDDLLRPRRAEAGRCAASTQKLRDGGFLLLGHSESLLNVDRRLRARPPANDLVYRKPGGAPPSGRDDRPPRTPRPLPRAGRRRLRARAARRRSARSCAAARASRSSLSTARRGGGAPQGAPGSPRT